MNMEMQIIHAVADARLEQLDRGPREHHPYGARAPQYRCVMGTLTPVQPSVNGVAGGVNAAQIKRLRALRDAGLLTQKQVAALQRLERDQLPGSPYPGPLRPGTDRCILWVDVPGLGVRRVTPEDPAWGLIEELRRNPVRTHVSGGRGVRLIWKRGVSEEERVRWFNLARRLKVQE